MVPPVPGGNPGTHTQLDAQMNLAKLKKMTLQDAENELSKRVYAATQLIEELEYTKSSKRLKRITGNGHHLRQVIAEFAVKLLRERWED